MHPEVGILSALTSLHAIELALSSTSETGSLSLDNITQRMTYHDILSGCNDEKGFLRQVVQVYRR